MLRIAAKSTHSLTACGAGFATKVIRCQTSRPIPEAVPSIVPSDIPAMSDDECLIRLAQAVKEHDSADLDEVARLIARLAVTIE